MKPFAVFFCLLITACGSIYTSPAVQTSDDLVSVIPLTAQTVLRANKSRHKPQNLPAVFDQVSGSGAGVKSLSTLPDPASDPETRQGPAQISLPSAVDNTPYTIGVSDVLLLATPSPTTPDALPGLFAAQSKRQGYTVQDDGAIAVPDVGRIPLAGLTLEEAEAAVFQALVEQQIDPTFSIEVAEFNSQHVSVGGAVNTPGLIPVSLNPLQLQDTLQMAGGVTTQAPEYATIRLYRDGKLYQIPLQELYAQPKLQKLHLTDGDSLFVDTDYRVEKAKAYFEEQIRLTEAKNSARAQALAELQTQINIQRNRAEEARENFKSKLELGAIKRDHVFLAGELANQGRFPLPFNNTASLADALYSDGGVLNQNGDLGQVYLLRARNLTQPITAYHLDASNVVNLLLATKMELRPNDIVFVSEQKVTAWNRVFGQLAPTLTAANQVSN